MLDSQDHADTTSARERRALERMVDVLCEHIELLIAEARRLGRLGSREAEFQLSAYEERKAQAASLCEAASDERWETRVCRFEKQVEALECSRSYFRRVFSDVPYSTRDEARGSLAFS